MAFYDVSRLRNEYTWLKKLDKENELIKVEVLQFLVPKIPQTYLISYFCKGIIKDYANNKIHIVDPKKSDNPFRVKVQLTQTYPLIRPNIRFLSPIFHPSINDPSAPAINFKYYPKGYICISDWSATRNLCDVALEIGMMIQLKNQPNRDYCTPLLKEEPVVDHIPTPSCKEAARWVHKNREKLPIDERSFIPIDNHGSKGFKEF